MHKLFILIFLLASLVLSTDSSSVFAKDTVKYRCGIANGFPPYQYRDDEGHSLGLDYEVARLVFKKAGLDVVFIQDNWEHLLFNLVHKRDVIDILFGAEVTSERLKLLDFTIPYYKRRIVLFTLKGSSIKKIESKKVVN